MLKKSLILAVFLAPLLTHGATLQSCQQGDLFNVFTGQSCTVVLSSGVCAAGDLFNTQTGQSCTQESVNLSSSTVVNLTGDQKNALLNQVENEILTIDKIQGDQYGNECDSSLATPTCKNDLAALKQNWTDIFNGATTTSLVIGNPIQYDPNSDTSLQQQILTIENNENQQEVNIGVSGQYSAETAQRKIQQLRDIESAQINAIELKIQENQITNPSLQNDSASTTQPIENNSNLINQDIAAAQQNIILLQGDIQAKSIEPNRYVGLENLTQAQEAINEDTTQITSLQNKILQLQTNGLSQ